jgi:hypothetical protein
VIHAGIDISNGTLDYQLKANSRVAIEGARWPFAGGTLTLQPVLLDFSGPSAKNLTFVVDGLDAAQFVQTLSLDNVAATGTFDGVVPLHFGADGAGRIDGGHLAARPEGGTISYTGSISEHAIGAYGVMAFEALKSLSYRRLDVTLDGALDGEFVSRIELAGIARNPAMTTTPSGHGIAGLVAGRVFHEVSRIPFNFHVQVRGRFRSLIAMGRSFSDPSALIRSALPPELQDATITPVRNVQHKESETVP